MAKNLSIAELSKYIPNGDVLGTQELKLRDQGISGIEELTQAKNLRKIDVSKNELESVSFIKYCWSLTDINLSNNSLNSVDDICNLENVRVLNISNNGIRSIESLCRSPGLQRSLKVLIANHNKIRHIPDLSCFKELETVILSHNDATEIEAPRNHCQKLKKLSLSNNSLKQFPFSLNFNMVQELRLNHNKIYSISQDITYMGNIRILELGHNFITQADPLFSLKKLKSLNISKNPCVTADEGGDSSGSLSVLNSIKANLESLESLNGSSISKARTKKRPDKRKSSKGERKEFGHGKPSSSNKKISKKV
ncbi:leucine rich repeat-containing protein [Cryptosporidium canis]|uniref:Leucine rich repeat-containing protein n=1 Tax=Cryptosporidium canis TaxID=195482 RepID=A0A9D5DIW8_9CRYT|nr:leucine rich repeat-containing protein [Cryptosporidium canis]